MQRFFKSTKVIPISEARRRLPTLLRRLQKHPEERVRITVHGSVVGELRAPEVNQPVINAGAALLKALKKIGEPTEPYPEGRSVAEDHDEFIYTR